MKKADDNPTTLTPAPRRNLLALAQTIRPDINLEKMQFWKPTNSNAEPEVRVFKRIPVLADDWEMKGVTRAQLAGDCTITVGYTHYGPLTTDDQRVYYALVQIWEEQGQPDGRVPFSRYRIAQILGKPPHDGDTRKAISASLQRLHATPFHWEYYYKHPETGRITRIEAAALHILQDFRNFIVGEEGPDGREGGYFIFADFILQNLRANNTKPVLLDQVIQFKSDIAQLLYTHLDLILNDKQKYERRSIELFDELGLKGSTYRYASKRKEVLERACKELKGKRLTTGVITGATIAPTKDSKDIKLVVTKGRAAKQLPAVAPAAEAAAPQTGQAAQLVAHFHLVFFGQRAYSTPQPRELGQARTLLEQYGFEQTKFIIEFARRAARATQFEMQTFGGVVQYASRAAAAYAQEQQQTAQLSREQAEAAHLSKYRAVYNTTYLWPAAERVLSAGDEHARALRKELQTWDSFGPREDLQGMKFISAEDFFRDCPELGVLTFWDWDRQHNPQPLQARAQPAAAGSS